MARQPGHGRSWKRAVGASLIAAAAAVLGSAGGVAAKQQTTAWGFCQTLDNRARSLRLSEVFSLGVEELRPGPSWLDGWIAGTYPPDLSAPAERTSDQWRAFEGSQGGAKDCLAYRTQAAAQKALDDSMGVHRRGGWSVQVVAWRPAGSSPPSAAPTPPPAVAEPSRPLPSLVVRSPEAEQAAAQRAADAEAARRGEATQRALADIARSREEAARRQAEAQARAAAAQAEYERKKREHEAALARNRAAQEEYRRKCEAVRAKGGSCVIER